MSILFLFTDFTSFQDSVKSMKIQEKLYVMREKVDFELAKPQTLFLDRNVLLQQNIALFKKKSFTLLRPISAVFEAEEAADAGGPIRENFTVLFEEFTKCKQDMFITTPTGYLLPTNNQRNVYGGMYEVLGTAIAAAAMNEAVSSLPLHPAIIYKICSSSKDP